MTHLSALDHFGRETKCATGKKKWTINPSPFLNTHPGAPHFQRLRLTATPIGQTAAIAIEIHKLPVQQPWIGNDGVRAHLSSQHAWEGDASAKSSEVCVTFPNDAYNTVRAQLEGQKCLRDSHRRTIAREPVSKNRFGNGDSQNQNRFSKLVFKNQRRSFTLSFTFGSGSVLTKTAGQSPVLGGFCQFSRSPRTG
jgi:hypothetical protein